MATAEYRIEPSTGLILLFDHGSIDFEAWEESVLGALRDAPRHGPLRWLSDRRGLIHPIWLGLLEEILGFLKGHARELDSARWAQLGRAGTVVQDALKLGEELASQTGFQLKAFIDLGSALRWLLPFADERELRRVTEWVERRGSSTT